MLPFAEMKTILEPQELFKFSLMHFFIILSAIFSFSSFEGG